VGNVAQFCGPVAGQRILDKGQRI